MVDKLVFFWGPAYFQARAVNFRDIPTPGPGRENGVLFDAHHINGSCWTLDQNTTLQKPWSIALRLNVASGWVPQNKKLVCFRRLERRSCFLHVFVLLLKFLMFSSAFKFSGPSEEIK